MISWPDFSSSASFAPIILRFVVSERSREVALESGAERKKGRRSSRRTAERKKTTTGTDVCGHIKHSIIIIKANYHIGIVTFYFFLEGSLHLDLFCVHVCAHSRMLSHQRQKKLIIETK